MKTVASSKLRTVLALACTFMLAAITLVAQEPPKKPDPPKPLDIVGKWAMTLEMEIGTANPTLVFKQQDGERFTGTYTGRYGTFELKGTLKGREIQFSFPMDTDGGQTTMSFAGQVSADAQTMKGTGTIEGLGDVTWSAKRDRSPVREARQEPGPRSATGARSAKRDRSPVRKARQELARQ